jgi:pyruvate/2-oxoglutarate dehydrogenase complex dihydrolipoamide dehydrogenase (E3) component
MTAEAFDAIIIGSGQGGNPLAAAMAKAGWKTAVIEREHVGGTCVNVGCTPTKTLVATARVAYLARRASDFGIGTGTVTTDMPAVIARKREIVGKSRGSSEKPYDNTPNLSLIRGEACFAEAASDANPDSPPDGMHTISVALTSGGEQTIASSKIILDTGLRTALPNLPGLHDISFLDNESIMELEVLPAHLMILGGGYIALEFAQIFRRLGSQVTIIQKGSALAEHEDPEVSEAIADILREDGIEILLNAEATHVEEKNRKTVLTVSVSGTEQTLTGSHLLVAIGRTPNTEALHCDRAGVALDEHGFVQVNERLETTTPGIWAIGDVKGGPAFTHISYDDFRVLKTNLLEAPDANPLRTILGRPVPYTMFLDPELGRIGMTETEARKAGKTIKVARMPMTSVARAFESAETRGFLKAIVDAETDQILGAAILGVDGGELAALIQVAMMGKVPASELREGIWSHPTRAEALNRLFGSYE